jgi:hypothetical protein
MDDIFNTDFKVNMGHKKQVTKSMLMQKNKEERVKREAIKRRNQASVLVQSALRGYLTRSSIYRSITVDRKLL